MHICENPEKPKPEDPRSGEDRRNYDDNVLDGTDRRADPDRRKEDQGPKHRGK